MSTSRLIWQCVHCAAQSWDSHGRMKIDKRWDEACMLNCFPVEDKQDGSPPKYRGDVWIDEEGKLWPSGNLPERPLVAYKEPPSYEEQIARCQANVKKTLLGFETNAFEPEDSELLQAAHDAVEAMNQRQPDLLSAGNPRKS